MGDVNFKSVMRYEPERKILRLFRVLWSRGTVGDGQGYSVKLSVALTPKLFDRVVGRNAWFVTLCGVRLHYSRSYGGTHV